MLSHVLMWGSRACYLAAKDFFSRATKVFVLAVFYVPRRSGELLHLSVPKTDSEALYSCCTCFSPSVSPVTKTSDNNRLLFRMGIS